MRWSCARCHVSVGQIDGTLTGLPTTWTRTDGSTFCLNCSRALAGEAALDSASDACSPEERLRLRREALIQFEIRRVPQAPNRTIANACRTSPKAVATVRDALGLAAPEHLPSLPGRA